MAPIGLRWCVLREEVKTVLERLYARRRFGVKLGLDVEEALLGRLGDPHKAYPVIHVAGTNGKGSVCAFVDSILRAAGLRTGLYTSPHLVRFNERIRVDGESIDDGSLGELAAAVEDASAAVTDEKDREPTFFECATAMALRHFRDAEVRMAVLETGMGGRLDATNVVSPLVSVITRVGMDHMTHLGPDIESIAGEKCGIMRPGVPVVCGQTDDTALSVIRREARRLGAPLIHAPERVSIRRVSQDFDGQKLVVESADCTYGTMRCALVGEHQLENLATAIAAVETMAGVAGIDFPEEAVREGAATVSWPGRCQLLRRDPPMILDGAHNPDASAALAKTVAALRGEAPIGLVAGMCGDKDMHGILAPFKRMVGRMWAVPISSARGADPREVLAAGRTLGWAGTATDLPIALAEAEAWARQHNGIICIAGSLFLAGDVLSLRERL